MFNMSSTFWKYKQKKITEIDMSMWTVLPCQLVAKSYMLRIFPHIDNRKIAQRVSLLLALSLQVLNTLWEFPRVYPSGFGSTWQLASCLKSILGRYQQKLSNFHPFSSKQHVYNSSYSKFKVHRKIFKILSFSSTKTLLLTCLDLVWQSF